MEKCEVFIYRDRKMGHLLHTMYECIIITCDFHIGFEILRDSSQKCIILLLPRYDLIELILQGQVLRAEL